MSLLYGEIAPAHPLLVPHVRLFWTLTADSLLEPQIVLPDGCPELIFHFGDPFLKFDSTGQVTRQTAAFVYGQIERAIVIQPSGVRSDIVGVRFQPAGLSAFTRIAQHELTEQMVDCRDLWGASPDFRDSTNADERIRTIEQFLCGRLLPQSATTAWHRDVSSRQNRRRFRDAVGLTPKRFARMQRLQLAVAQLGGSNLAEVAVEAGYFDQAHFTRDFREFTGQTPAQFLRQRHDLSDFFTHNVRNVQDAAPLKPPQ